MNIDVVFSEQLMRVHEAGDSHVAHWLGCDVTEIDPSPADFEAATGVHRHRTHGSDLGAGGERGRSTETELLQRHRRQRALLVQALPPLVEMLALHACDGHYG